MAFELRIAGRTVASYDSEAEAVAAARGHIQQDADRQVEIIDGATGRAVAPGASERSREHLANKAGF